MRLSNYSSKDSNIIGYTDAPRLHPNLLVGSLQLLVWLFYHPSAWRNHVNWLEPGLRADFTLTDLSRARQLSPHLRRTLIQGYFILPLLSTLPVGLILWRQGAPLDQAMVTTLTFILAINLALALMIGAVVSVAAGIAGGVTVGLAFGLAASITSGYVESIAVPTAMSVAIGAVGSVTAMVASQPGSGRSTEPVAYRTKVNSSLWTQVGSIVIGLLIGVGVATLVQLGLTTLAGLIVGVTENTAYWLARTIVVGGSFGLALGWRRGVAVGLAGGIGAALVYGLAVTGIETQFLNRSGFLVDSGLAIGLASGLLFGTSFGVTVVLPYVLAEHIGGAWAGAWAGALGSWGRHIFRNEAPLGPALPLGFAGITVGLTLSWWLPLLLYPLLAAWNLSLYQWDKRQTGFRSPLLRFHAAFWDEFQRLPWSGLDDYLLLALDRHPQAGQAALEYLRSGRQRWAVQAVQLELEARRLEHYQEIAALGSAHRELTPGELDGPASVLLRQFNHLSQDIEAALNQTTVYHQRLALKVVDDRLTGLIRELTLSNSPNAARFYPIAHHWQQLVEAHSRQLAGAIDQSREIDNPYVVGVPLTRQQEIFVGRADIVARIEQLLLDQRRPPLLLYGQRRMGKTSLLHNLGRLLPRTIAPLFVDGQRIALAGDYPDFLYNLAAEIKKSAERQRQLSLPPLSRPALAGNPFTCFNEWLDDLEETLGSEGYKTALLALDEFEMVATGLVKGRFDEMDILSTLRHMIQHRTRFSVLLASSHPLEEFQRWAGYLINVQVIKIGYLAQTEAVQLIEHPIKNFGLRYQPEAVQEVLALTRGHPALLQLLCYELVALKNEQEIASRQLVSVADVEAAVRRALHSGSFFFADIDQNQVDATGRTLLRALASFGPAAATSPAALAAACRVEQPGALDHPLKLLLQRDLIETCDGGYRFQVELIRRWFAQPV